jgi:two-component system, sensor histidine kinase and response regulator
MKEQILIVEDDRAMSTGIRDVLDMAGYKVQLAENGQEALQVLTRFRPDLIISDIMMPEMDGYELLEELRRQPNWAAVPFIFLTAKRQRADIRAGKQLGADDYLVKSVDLDDLLVVVRAKLDRAIVLKQQSLKEMETLKNTILNMLSHEFRTPLTYITGYVDLLQEGNWSVDDLQRLLGRIKGGSVRLNRLVEDFLLLVRFETGDAYQAYLMDKRPFNGWAALIRRVFDGLRDLAAHRSVSLVADVSPDLPLIDAHENYLENALHRLVDNAIKFSKPGGGQVAVHVTADDRRVCVRVIDQGIGIPAVELAKMFDKFHQINRERMEQQGAGISLAIVRGIAELHQGEVECSSEEGVGSEFRIYLPAM